MTTKQSFVKILRFVPMPVLAILVGLLAGVVLWAALDLIQGRAVTKIFTSELHVQLELRSRESLVRFDRYIANYAATTRLLANHRRLAEYLDPVIWRPEDAIVPTVYDRFQPAWLPDIFDRYDLPAPSHVLLLDGDGQVREIYHGDAGLQLTKLSSEIRGALTKPGGATTILLTETNEPYLVTGDRIEDSAGYPMGHLVVLVPIDAAFLAASQQGLALQRVAVALIDFTEQRILSSIDPDSLTPGTLVTDWDDDHVVTSLSLPHYEDLDLHLATFVPHASVDRMSRHVRSFEWRQRALAALVFILFYSLVIYLVSARLNRILTRMSRFAHRALGIEQPRFRRGVNQLVLLEEWIQDFTQLVLKARQELSRHYEHEMRETEALKAAIMEASLDSIVTIDGRGRIIEFNPTAESALGLRRNEALGRLFAARALPASERPRFERLLAQSRLAQREGREPHVRGELAALRGDGSTMPVELSIVPIDVDDQSFYTLYMHDITKRRETEREIKSLARFASESPSPVLRVTRRGRIVYANRASRDLLKSWDSDANGHLPSEWLQEVADALVDGRTREKETVAADRTFALLLTPISDLGYVNIYARDITAVRRAEQEARQHQAELVHVSRLSTLGEVATGMAHELNQPLSAIVNFANGASRRLQGPSVDPDQLVQVMGQIANQAQRASEIIRRLRALVGKQPPIRADTDLNHLIREVCTFVEFEANRANVTIHLDLAPVPVPISVDLVQIEQVLLNLIRNALDALSGTPSDDRRLTIRTRAAHDDAECVIEDNGPGIDPAQMGQLFEPFFTTKETGMGMGLAISQTIIADHQGRIWVESSPCEATRFHIALPIRSSRTETITDNAT